jgi:ABC-2 type transport system permease protein
MSGVSLAWEQFRLERKMFWRNPSAAFFNFILPLLMLLLIASVFGADKKELRILIPGIAGLSVLATTFNALTFNLTFLREQGILKRMRGTPVPTTAYFGGLLGSAVLNAFVQVALVVVIGHVLYDVPWPHDVPALIGWTALGVTCFGSLGIAFSHVIPNFDSAPAYTNAVFLPAIFISGVFYSTDTLPKVLEWIAQALPLKHMIDGLSSAIVGRHINVAASLAVVAGWTVFGLFFAVRNFRWE